MVRTCLTMGNVVKSRETFDLTKKAVGKQQFVNEHKAMTEFGGNIYKSLQKIIDRLVEIRKLPENSKEQFLTLNCLKFLSSGVEAFKSLEKTNGLDMSEFISEAVAYITDNYVSVGSDEGAYTKGLSSDVLRDIEMSDLQTYIAALKAGKSFTADNGLTLIDEDTFIASLWNDYVVVRYMRVWSFKKFGVMFDDNSLLCLYTVANKENTDIDVVAIVGGAIYYDDKSQLVFKFKDEDGEKLLETGIYSFEDLCTDMIDYHNNAIFYMVIGKSIRDYLLECKIKGDTSLTSVDDVKAYYAANSNKGYFDDENVYRLFAFYGFDNEFDIDVHSDEIRQASISILDKTVTNTELDFRNAILVTYNGIDFDDFVVDVE